MNTQLRIRTAAIAAILISSVLSAGAAEWWVAIPADGGDDENAGTSEAPFATIQKALTLAQDGDTVKVRAGTYSIPATANETVGKLTRCAPAYNLTNAVSVIAVEGPERTILDGSNTVYRRAFRLKNPDAVVSGFAIQRVYSEAQSKTGDDRFSAYLEVKNGLATNCVLRSNTANGSGVTAGIWASGGTIVDCVVSNMTHSTKINGCCGIQISGAVTVRGCLVEKCTSRGTGCIDVGGANAVVRDCVVRRCTSTSYIVTQTAAGALVSHCVVTNNTGTTAAVQVANATAAFRNCLVADNAATSATGAGGIVLANGTVESCTVANNRNSSTATSGWAHGVLQSGGDILNSVIACNASGGAFGDSMNHVSTGGTCSYTCTYPLQEGEGNTTISPSFVDLAAGNFHLASDSGLLNIGSKQTWMQTATDLDGNSRIRGGGVDIGCYERQSDGFIITVR